jgi:hypothetical protein
LEQQLNDFINKGHISPVNPLGVLMFYSWKRKMGLWDFVWIIED